MYASKYKKSIIFPLTKLDWTAIILITVIVTVI